MAGGQKELLLSEGTVILHVTFALKQDQVYVHDSACKISKTLLIYMKLLCAYV